MFDDSGCAGEMEVMVSTVADLRRAFEGNKSQTATVVPRRLGLPGRAPAGGSDRGGGGEEDLGGQPPRPAFPAHGGSRTVQAPTVYPST